MRLTNEQLEEIKKDYGVDVLWSWSKISSWYTSKYEWFLHYIMHEEPDRLDCIYGKEGSYSHDIIEKYYNKEIPYKEMINDFQYSWDTARDMLGLKFNRSDAEKDKSVAKRYYNNLKLFFEHHQPLDYKLHTEEFAIIKVGNNVLQGYIDAWYQDENNVIHIIDWKTSSIYTGKTLEEKSGQLVCYAMYFMQKGIPIDRIKLHFNFLKYATITYEQANGKIKSTNVERGQLGDKLQSSCKMWLKKLGYEDKLDDYLKRVLDTSDIKCLPKDIQEKISISDCYVDVPLTMELVKYWKNYIITTINEIEEKIMLYEIYGDESVFYDSIDDIEKESFYYATLSEYSANKNICYAKYLEQLDNELGLDILKYV